MKQNLLIAAMAGIGMAAATATHAQTQVMSDYCDYATGHQCNPDFADAQSHISLSIGLDSEGKMEVSIASRGHEQIIDLLWVNTSHGILQYGAAANDGCTYCSTSASLSFDLGGRTDDFVINQLHWSYKGCGDEWAADCGFAVPCNASCNVVSDDHTAPVISTAEVVGDTIGYDRADLRLVADDETSGACKRFIVNDQANGIVNRALTVDAETRIGTLDQLTPETAYNFSITTHDDTGNASTPASLQLTTAKRASDCSGSFGHFTCNAEDCRKISVSTSYGPGGVTYTMRPIDDTELTYAEVCIVNYGAHQMTIAADGWADYGRMMYYKVGECQDRHREGHTRRRPQSPPDSDLGRPYPASPTSR